VVLAFLQCDSRKRAESAELIIFARVGTTRAYGAVSSISPTGGDVSDLLANGHGGLIYETVSAQTLDGPVIVLARQQQDPAPHLFQCASFDSSTCRRMFPATTNKEGSGFISPNGRQIVAVMAAPGQQYSLWIADPSGSGLRQLTAPPLASWDTLPVWSPDGSTILFTRLSKSSIGLRSVLMKTDLAGMESQVIPDDVAVGSYSPDGKLIAFWSKNGLEVMDLASSVRSVVRPPLPGQQLYSTGRISWSSAADKFVMVFKSAQGSFQLTTISRDGSRVQTLYSSPEFALVSAAFVRRVSAH
jgi:hypothetical protein